MDSLISDPTWVKRRVETVTILDERIIERHITLDIDFSDVELRAFRFGLDQTILPIPLAAMRKQLQLDLDLRDAQDVPLASLVSDADAYFSHAYLLAVLNRHYIDIHSLPHSVVDDLYRICRLNQGTELFEDILLQLNDNPPNLEIAGARQLTAVDKDAWYALLRADRDSRQQEISVLVTELSGSYHLMTDLASAHRSGDVTLVKYRRLEVWNNVDETRAPTASRLGFEPFVIEIPASGIGTAAREHTRIVAPNDLTVRSAALVTPDANMVPEHHYEKRTDVSRAVIYTTLEKMATRKRYSASVELRPRRGSFLLPANLAVGGLLVILSISLLAEIFEKSLTRKDSAVDAAVAVLILLPSILIVELARKGEHRLVAKILLIPRVTTLLVVAVSLLAALGVALGLQRGVMIGLLLGAVTACLLVFSYLTVLNARIK